MDLDLDEELNRVEYKQRVIAHFDFALMIKISCVYMYICELLFSHRDTELDVRQRINNINYAQVFGTT